MEDEEKQELTKLQLKLNRGMMIDFHRYKTLQDKYYKQQK